jgi:hypothetical protein
VHTGKSRLYHTVGALIQEQDLLQPNGRNQRISGEIRELRLIIDQSIFLRIDSYHAIMQRDPIRILDLVVVLQDEFDEMHEIIEISLLRKNLYHNLGHQSAHTLGYQLEPSLP